MPTLSTDENPEEDQYLYTTVTITEPAKPKKEKDTTFCLVVFFALFTVIGEQLCHYSFQTSFLHVTQLQYVEPLNKIERKLRKDYVRNRNSIARIWNELIPVIFGSHQNQIFLKKA